MSTPIIRTGESPLLLVMALNTGPERDGVVSKNQFSDITARYKRSHVRVLILGMRRVARLIAELHLVVMSEEGSRREEVGALPDCRAVESDTDAPGRS